MKVILLENIKKIGSIGEIIDVKRGFARNFLIANQKALYASKENISEVEKIKTQLAKKDDEKKLEANSILEKINKKKIVVREGLVERAEFQLTPFDVEKPPMEEVIINSKPEGAIVVLDGKEVGNTPWRGPIPCGTHDVETRIFGYLPQKNSLQASMFDSNAEALLKFGAIEIGFSIFATLTNSSLIFSSIIFLISSFLTTFSLNLKKLSKDFDNKFSR